MARKSASALSPEAALEGRLLAIQTGLLRAINQYQAAQPSTKYPEIPYAMGEAYMQLEKAAKRAEVARCEQDNEKALTGLTMVNKAVVSHLRGGSRG